MLRFDQSSVLALWPRRLVRFALAGLSGAAFLAGCGFVKFEPREAWRAEAELSCMRSGIVRESQWIRSTKPIDGPGPCGTDLPLKVAAFQNDTTTLSSYASMSVPQWGGGGGMAELKFTVLKPEATMGCPMVAWTDDWVAGAVQPAAMAWFGQGVKEIRTGGAYACRRRNHNPNARLSEHAFGNAIDVMSFVFADGNVVTVKGGWRGNQAEQGFLRDVLHGACQRFKTVLGPGSDALHYDHFHLDLARHDQRGQRRYCKPKIDPPQRPMPGMIAQHQQMPPVPGGYGGALGRPGYATPAPPAQSGPLGEDRFGGEVEEDFDPKNFDVTASTLDLPRPRRGVGEKQPLPAPSPRMLPEAGAFTLPMRTIPNGQ